MWIIKMKHVGKDKTYTKQEESATNEQWAKIKYQRMIVNWYHILCKDVKLHNDVLFDYTKSDLLLQTIQFQLQVFNDGSTFEISMEELEE